MADHIPEDDLLELATGERSLATAPTLEAHLADCAACSGLLCTLLASTERRDLVGKTLGPYRVDALIGAGAMGEVYRAWDTRLARAVALKALPAQLASSPERVRRLETEARAAAGIAHPNVVTVFDTGTAEGVTYVVAELVEGESLRSLIDRGAVARPQVLALALARGVAAAHARGVVHRDLKPSNLIVADDGTLKILDFGLAKVTGERDVDTTEPGTLLGTSGYLSPEQARGEPADARSDIFAIGAIVYELVSGRRAFGGATFAERLSAVLRDTPPALDHPVWPIVARCLEKDPRQRFQSAADLAFALEGGPAPGQRRARVVVSRRAFLAGTAATGIGGVVLGRALAPAAPRAFVPTYQQLTFRHGRVGRARFTADGGSVVYSALWEDSPSTLFTTRLAGGGTRALALPPAHLLAVSTRGQLALSLDHRFVEGFSQAGQLALAPLEGGTPRALGTQVQDADFAPDGELCVIRRVGGRFRLELPLGTVLHEASWISHARVSPDGTRVACCVHDVTSDDRGDLAIISRTGGRARTVAAGFSSIDGVAWSADGRVLWISAALEGGNNSVHAYSTDGDALRHVPAAGRMRVHDLSRAGALALAQSSGRLRLAGKPPGARSELDLGLADVSMLGGLARDGSTVAFSEYGDVDTYNGVYFRGTDGSAPVRLGDGVVLDLDEARGVLAHRGVPGALAVYPTTAGPPQPLSIGPLAGAQRARWCAGGVAVIASRDHRPRRLWRVDRTVTAISGEGVDAPFAVSPDGTQAALVIAGELRVYELGAGTLRVVPGTYADESVCGWGPPGIYVCSPPSPIRVRRIDRETGSATPVLEVTPPLVGLRGVRALAISDAGDAYAYSYSQELSRLYSMTTQ